MMLPLILSQSDLNPPPKFCCGPSTSFKITVAVGIAPSKTLAKKYTQSGVYDLRDLTLQHQIMAQTPITNLWGVAERLGHRLECLGIKNHFATGQYRCQVGTQPPRQ